MLSTVVPHVYELQPAQISRAIELTYVSPGVCHHGNRHREGISSAPDK